MLHTSVTKVAGDLASGSLAEEPRATIQHSQTVSAKPDQPLSAPVHDHRAGPSIKARWTPNAMTYLSSKSRATMPGRDTSPAHCGDLNVTARQPSRSQSFKGFQRTTTAGVAGKLAA